MSSALLIVCSIVTAQFATQKLSGICMSEYYFDAAVNSNLAANTGFLTPVNKLIKSLRGRIISIAKNLGDSATIKTNG